MLRVQFSFLQAHHAEQTPLFSAAQVLSPVFVEIGVKNRAVDVGQSRFFLGNFVLF